MPELTMSNGEVVDVSSDPFADMQLRCTGCNDDTDPERRADDPDTVVRCSECGKRHSTDSLEYVDG